MWGNDDEKSIERRGNRVGQDGENYSGVRNYRGKRGIECSRLADRFDLQIAEWKEACFHSSKEIYQ